VVETGSCHVCAFDLIPPLQLTLLAYLQAPLRFLLSCWKCHP
jgi:hypothetical protein